MAEVKMTGVNHAKNGCSYIVMRDHTGWAVNTNVRGDLAQFFCKKEATGTVEQYRVEVSPATWTAEGKYVLAPTALVDVRMCEKHIKTVAGQRARIAKWEARQAKKEAGK